MNTLKKASSLLPRIKLFNPNSAKREFNLTEFGLPYNLKHNVKKLNDLSIEITNNELINFPKFVKHCNTYNDSFGEFITDNDDSVDVYLTKPTDNSINWNMVKKSKMLGNNTDGFLHIMGEDGNSSFGHRDGWRDSNLQKYLRNIFETDNIPQWVHGVKVNSVPESLRKYAWSTYSVANRAERTYYDLFVTGPRLLYEFDTKTDSLKQYMWMKSLDKKAHTVNNFADLLEHSCSSLHDKIVIAKEIEKCGSLDAYLADMTDEEIVTLAFHNDAFRAKCVGAMVEVINIVEGAKDLIVNRYDSPGFVPSSADYDIYTAIATYPKVRDCDHSELSELETFTYAKHYFKYGPKRFITNMLMLDDLNLPNDR